MFFVYILKSRKTKSYYTGYTENIGKRCSEQNCGFSQYTRGKCPWDLVYLEAFKERKMAIRREREIKSFKGGNSFKRIVNKKI